MLCGWRTSLFMNINTWNHSDKHLLLGYDFSGGFTPSRTSITQKYTHTTHNLNTPSTHSTPKLQRGEEPALHDNPPAHMRVTHMLGGLLNIPLMGEKTRDTGWGGKWVRDNTTGKKALDFFSLNDWWLLVSTCRRKNRGTDCDGSEGMKEKEVKTSWVA